MGKLRPATGLNTAREILQQIKKNQQIFVKVKWPETLCPFKCLCWSMNVFVFINHAVYILHYLRSHHPILIGADLWRFMAHWRGPCPEKFAHHCANRYLRRTGNFLDIFWGRKSEKVSPKAGLLNQTKKVPRKKQVLKGSIINLKRVPI